MTPIIAFERLFFAVFGQTSPDDINSQRSTRPEWTENLFKIVFGIYMLVSVVVLINLLIAMMSDTYQRIQVRPEFGKVPKSRFLFLLFFSFPLVTTTCVCVRGRVTDTTTYHHHPLKTSPIGTPNKNQNKYK